jgi:hypothetical protein
MKIPALPITIACLALVLPFQAAGQLHDGENLLQPLPLPEGKWFATPSTQGRDEIVDWRKGDSDDRVRTVILRGRGGYPATRFREINYKAGHESCATFNGRVLDDSPVNGYGRSLWVGDCTQADGSSVTALWVFITGKDSSYFLFRQWHGVPDAAAMDQWVGYFKQIKVCDTRPRRKAPCSEPAASTPNNSFKPTITS